MKVIQNVTAEDKEVLKAPLEMATPQSVNTIADVRMVDKICTKIEAVPEGGGDLPLEDTEFSYLRERFDNYTNWSTEPKSRKLILAATAKLDAIGKS